MKTFPLVAFVFAAGLAHATTPTHLELIPSGSIAVHTDKGEGLEIRTEFSETSSGTWKRPTMHPPRFTPVEGSAVERGGDLTFSDGSTASYVVRAEIEGQTVKVRAAWTDTSTAAGFGRVDLWIPEALAADLTIEADGVVQLEDRNQRRNLRGVQKAVLKRTSTGEFLCSMLTEGLDLSLFFSDADPSRGVTIRVFNVPEARTALFNQNPSLSWTLSFDPASATPNEPTPTE